MYSTISSTNIKESSFIIVNNGVVVKASKSFLNMTEYKIDDLLNKDIVSVFRTLRVGPNINYEDLDEKAEYFLFTKSLEVRTVQIKVVKKAKEQMYVITEKSGSRIKDKFGYLHTLFSQNTSAIAIYSVPDLVLLKASQRYLDLFHAPYNTPENALGKRANDIITKFKNGVAEDLLKNMISKGKSKCIKEDMSNKHAKAVTYLDSTLTPLLEEGKVKYLVSNTQDVTERVLYKQQLEEKNRIIEQQQKELEAVLDNMVDGFSIIDKDGNYTKVNKAAREQMLNREINNIEDITEVFQHYDTEGKELAKNEFPASRILRGEKLDQYELIVQSNEIKRYLSISGTPIYDENGDIVMGVISSRDITDTVLYRKKIKEQLEEIKLKNKQMEAIFEGIQDSISIFDRQGRYLMKSSTHKKQFERTDGDIRTLTEKVNFFDMDGKPICKEELFYHKVMKGKKINNLKMKLVTNGKERYVDISGAPILNENNEFEMGIIFTVDITEAINLSKQIKQQKEKLKLFIDNMSDGLFLLDKNKKFTLLNKAMEDIFYNPNSFEKIGDSLVHTRYFDIEENELKIDDLPWSRVLRGEKIQQLFMKIERPDKTIYCSISGKPIYNQKGSIEYAVLCIRDISEKIQYEKEIKQQKEMLEAIIRSMSDGLELVNEKKQITFLNDSAKKFFYKPDSNINVDDELEYNKYYYGVDGKEIPPEDLPSFRIFNKGCFQNYILTIERPDKKIYVSVNGSLVYNNNGITKEAILCTRDITEQIMQDKVIKHHQETALRAEKEKIEALEKAIDMKDEFLSIISHEFRTPLNVINTAIQTMYSIYGNELSDKVKEYIGMIRRNTYRQLRLVNNLLDITRANAGRSKILKKNIDIVFLTKSITESIYPYASEKGIMLTFKSSFEKKIIGIDDEKYERILLNLLSNAIKFTPRDKSISVKVCGVKNNICIEVTDTGIGIPKDKIDMIFERFGQVDSSLSRQAEGTGIGLSLVKRFVQELGGSISVESKVGKGSTFIILFPDEKVEEESDKKPVVDFMYNNFVEATTVEFSDIYL